jgi:hypothetical protein
MVPALLRPKAQQIHLKATMKGWKYNYRDPRSVITITLDHRARRR